jgi:hypothetical protein
MQSLVFGVDCDNVEGRLRRIGDEAGKEQEESIGIGLVIFLITSLGWKP